MFKHFFASVSEVYKNNSIVVSRQKMTLIIAAIVSFIATFVDIFQNMDNGFTTLAYIEIVIATIYLGNLLLFRLTHALQTHALIHALTFTFHIVISFIIDGYGVDIMLFLLAILPTVLFLLLHMGEVLVLLTIVSFVLAILTLNSYFLWIEPLFNFDVFIQLTMIFPFYAILVYTVERSRNNAEIKVIKRDKEKEVLLKEVHHRVKNNMQLMMSLLGLQAATIEEHKYSKMFLDNVDRIAAMALVHESIYKAEDFEKIDMQSYLEDIVKNLQKITDFEISTVFEPITLDMKTAMNLGLILNEAVTNAIEHAYKEDENGHITLTLEKKDKIVSMKIQDYGTCRLDTDKKEATLGMTLMHDLSNSLNAGRITVDSKNGYTVHVMCEVEDGIA